MTLGEFIRQGFYENTHEVHMPSKTSGRTTKLVKIQYYDIFTLLRS